MRTWISAIVWTLLVLLASSEPLSAAHTGAVLRTVMSSMHVRLSNDQFDVLHFLIRKAAHLTEYAILGLLWYRAVDVGRASARHRPNQTAGLRPGLHWSWRHALIAIAIAAVVATLDEFHQSFIPQRTPSPYDVMLDIAGATIAQCGLWLRMLLFVPS